MMLTANHNRRVTEFVSLEVMCVSEGRPKHLKHVMSQETGGQVQHFKTITRGRHFKVLKKIKIKSCYNLSQTI